MFPRVENIVTEQIDTTSSLPEPEVTWRRLQNPDVSFNEALTLVAVNKTVLLAMVDQAVSSMAVNFYLTCLKPHSISNYLLLTIDNNTCGRISRHFPINCFFYKSLHGGEVASEYGSQIFKDKMNVRTKFVLEALYLDYTVLHTDIDMYFMRDPFKAISCPRSSCHIAPLKQHSGYNAGFLLVNPSAYSKLVYEHMKIIARGNRKTDDQQQLNIAIRRHKKRGLIVVPLPEHKFLSGYAYYERERRYFADTMTPCSECVVVHNNWIVSLEAKVYRSKELHQWMYDDNQYYSSTTTKYLTYSNTLPRENSLNALKAALAISDILNRVLILPKFFCDGTACPLNSFLRVSSFNRRFKYREHSFLSHPLVPESVKSSLSPVYLITTDNVESEERNITRIPPHSPHLGMNDDEIRQHFSSLKQAVLRFHSLYHSFHGYQDASINRKWQNTFKEGLKRSNYRQMI